LKHGSKIFLLWGSAALVLAGMAMGSAGGGGRGQKPGLKKPSNELMLAGLRPGRDTLETAKRMYGGEFRIMDSDDAHAWAWIDTCRHRTLRVEGDNKGVIQVLGLEESQMMAPCRPGMTQSLHSDTWKTGRGLSIGDLRSKVIGLYGEPGSSGPSTGEGRDLEMLYYAFDWAGSDVPQVMEVYCDRATGRVAHLTLSYPSL
jgi:hypothetical protein